MKTITVDLAERSYPIYIGRGALHRAKLFHTHITAKQVLVVSNPVVAAHYMSPLRNALQDFQCDEVLLPDGEAYKNVDTWMHIFDRLLEKKHHRNTTLIALGGGVVCDMTGFAAACYQRGVNFIQVPTSLLAQVDASIGGKTAINHPLGKNMLGAFHQPVAVIIDTQVLHTLPAREFSAGLAEIIKTALIEDADFFVWLEQHMQKLLQHDDAIVEQAIYQSCVIKARIVAEDEKELTGRRALLNLGHTFGHAIEKVFNYGTWLHGEAVAMGMILAANFSYRLGWLSQQDVERIKNLILAANLPVQLPQQTHCDKILEAMAVDKKFTDANYKLVLLPKVGQARLMDQVDRELVKQVLQEAIPKSQ